MKPLPILAGAALACALSLPALPAQSLPFRLECSNGVPFKLVWESLATKRYDLWFSGDLAQWTRVGG